MIPQTLSPALSARDLAIGYEQGGKKRFVAKGLALDINPGDFVCLLGPNGTGKSTLIRSLAGMQTPLEGKIEIGGADSRTISPRERARLISVVLTDTLPVGMMDGYSMVALGRHPYSGWLGRLAPRDHTQIKWAIQAVGALGLASRQVAELSDGERQKISIARALAQEARVMLLDEPTAFLDLPRRVELMRILRDLAHRENLAILLSTHDLDLALRFADRLWLIDQAGHVAHGFPEELAMNGQFAQIFKSESLNWDPASGSFRAHANSCLPAFVEGEGVAALWTRRALERLGFEPTTNPETALKIRVESSVSWQVRHAGADHHFTGLAELIAWVTAQRWEPTDFS